MVKFFEGASAISLDDRAQEVRATPRRACPCSPEAELALLASFATNEDVDIGALEAQVVHPDADQLRNAKSAGQRDVQHRAIPNAHPGRGIRRIEQGALLVGRQVPYEPPVAALGGNREDAADLLHG